MSKLNSGNHLRDQNIGQECTPGTHRVKKATQLKVETHLDLTDKHRLLIEKGASPKEIVQLLGEYLGIDPWKAGKFLGALNVLPAIGEEQMQGFEYFLATLNIWLRGRVVSKNQPTHMLLSGITQSIIFGEKNMMRIDPLLDQVRRDWGSLGSIDWNDLTDSRTSSDEAKKEEYLREQFGIIAKGSWNNLPSIINDESHGSAVLVNSMNIHGDYSKLSIRHNSVYHKRTTPYTNGLCLLM